MRHTREPGPEDYFGNADEAIVALTNGNILHVQEGDASTWDFTIYGSNMAEIDGGQLDTSADLREAIEEICDFMDIEAEWDDVTVNPYEIEQILEKTR